MRHESHAQELELLVLGSVGSLWRVLSEAVTELSLGVGFTKLRLGAGKRMG